MSKEETLHAYSLYLEPGRLADVIAALQVMAAGERPEGSIAKWADVLSGNKNETSLGKWEPVFRERHLEWI